MIFEHRETRLVAEFSKNQTLIKTPEVNTKNKRVIATHFQVIFIACSKALYTDKNTSFMLHIVFKVCTMTFYTSSPGSLCLGGGWSSQRKEFPPSQPLSPHACRK